MNRRRTPRRIETLHDREAQQDRAVHALYAIALAVIEEPHEFAPELAALARRGDLHGLVDAVAAREALSLRATRHRGGYTQWSRTLGGFGPFNDLWRALAVDRLERNLPASSQRPNPPRRGALVEIVRRDDGYWYRNPLGHLSGPFSERRRAMAEGALTLAHALHPTAPKADLVEIANALLTEDRARPYVRRFSDGWRVWHPGREGFVGRAVGEPFTTQGDAERRRRELAGEPESDGPMFLRAGAVAAPAQLGLFTARENPTPGLAPLRGSPGESVTYHPRADGLVAVRASHAGVGISEREMSPAQARAHHERLLALGYRPNPLRPRGSSARRTHSPAQRSR